MKLRLNKGYSQVNLLEQTIIFLPFSFSQLSKLITDNGGKVVDLTEPKLTHIVVDKRDVSRRLELMKRTSKSVTFTPNLAHQLMRNFKAQATLSCCI